MQTKGLNPLNSDPSDLYVPYVMDPSNSSRLLAGTDRIYETTDQANDWNAISTPGKNGWTTSLPTGSDPTVDAIAVAAQKPNTIYAAAGPDIFVTTDDGASWQVHDLIASSSITATSSPINFSSRFSALLADPNDPTGNTAYALIASFNTDASGNSEHVYRTTNGGITWTNITGNLKDQPMNSLAFDASTRVLYLGTDTGVFASDTYTQGSIDGLEFACAGSEQPAQRPSDRPGNQQQPGSLGGGHRWPRRVGAASSRARGPNTNRDRRVRICQRFRCWCSTTRPVPSIRTISRPRSTGATAAQRSAVRRAPASPTTTDCSR